MDSTVAPMRVPAMRRSSAIPSSILTLAEIVIPGKVDGNPPMPEDT
ncbi:hypothetical protein [Pseudomonas sp. RL_105y_Pfl2_101]